DRSASEVREEPQHPVDRAVEEEAEGQGGPRPEQRPRRREGEEAGKRRACRPRERRRDGGITGDELREKKGRETVRVEEALGLADAGVGGEGQLAERLEDLLPEAPAKEEPDRVGRDRRDECRGEEPAERQLALRRERARHEECRNRGDRNAELLGENVQEDETDAVLKDESAELVHVS